MIARQLEKLLATLSGYQAGEIDQRIRPLRGTKAIQQIPHGPRGTNAPHIQSSHAAWILLAMVARRASDSLKVLVRASALKMVPRRDFKIGTVGETRLQPLIALALDTSTHEYITVERVEIASDGSKAWASIVIDGRMHDVIFVDDKWITKNPASYEAILQNPESYDAYGSTYCGHRFVISSAVLNRIAVELNISSSDKGGSRLSPSRKKSLSLTES